MPLLLHTMPCYMPVLETGALMVHRLAFRLNHRQFFPGRLLKSLALV